MDQRKPIHLPLNPMVIHNRKASSACARCAVDDLRHITVCHSSAYRPGQLLETVPGLTVTSHSGEGKANQYMMRGYNLDHGTDLAVFVDAMPVNEPTHTHGQGYADVGDFG